MAKRKNIYNSRATKQREKQDKAKELEALLAGYSPEVIAAVLGKRDDVTKLLPTTKKDKLLQVLTENTTHPKCPNCGASEVQHYGYDRKRFPRYKCTACGRTFGMGTNSLIANSSWSYDIWVSFIYHTLMEHSLAQTKQALEDDYEFYTTEATLLSYRHRLFQYIALRWSMPKLHSTCYLDETFFRESQKGSRHLLNVSPKYIEERRARIPDRAVPSEYGIYGPEFCCVVAGIDTVGHVVAVVTGLGRNTAAPFGDYFSEYLGNIEILCTDGYKVYSQYCSDHNLIHYVQISKWRDNLKAERDAYKERYGKVLSEEEARKRLYGKQELDYIENFPRRLTYEEFEQLKAEKGLSLNPIDAVHGRMKRYINSHMAGVSTVNLAGYLAFYCFRHNWSVDHDHKPPASMQVAKEIFTELLSISNIPQNEAKMTLQDMNAVPTRYVRSLALATEELKKRLNDRGFTISDGDELLTFNKRKYFRTASRRALEDIAKAHHIKGRSKMGVERLAQEICKLPEADDIFLHMVALDGLHAKYLPKINDIISKKKEREAEDEEERKRKAKKLKQQKDDCSF